MSFSFSSIRFSVHAYYLIFMSFGLACAVLVSKNKKIIFSFIFGFLTGPIALVYYLIRKETREGLSKTKEQEFVEEKFSKIAKGAGKFGSKLQVRE